MWGLCTRTGTRTRTTCPSRGTRLGSCTGDLRSCANVPSMGGPTLFLNVVLCLFWQHQFGSNGKNPGERCFMGPARQNWPFPPRAYKGVRTSARPQFCTQSHRKPTMQPPAPRQGLQSPWKNFLIFAVLTLTLGVQTQTLTTLTTELKKFLQGPNL